MNRRVRLGVVAIVDVDDEEGSWTAAGSYRQEMLIYAGQSVIESLEECFLDLIKSKKIYINKKETRKKAIGTLPPDFLGHKKTWAIFSAVSYKMKRVTESLLALKSPLGRVSRNR